MELRDKPLRGLCERLHKRFKKNTAYNTVIRPSIRHPITSFPGLDPESLSMRKVKKPHKYCELLFGVAAKTNPYVPTRTREDIWLRDDFVSRVFSVV